MKFIELHDKKLTERVSRQGASVVDLWYDGLPVLRPYTGKPGHMFNVLDAACFPFVPFCGRIEGNEFYVDAKHYALCANTAEDIHCLHGDGWLSEWSVLEVEAERVCLSMAHAQTSMSPYQYDASLEISVRGGQLRMNLSVVNRGKAVLPFGIGFHPYFPLTSSTMIQFHAEGYRDERNDHLPGVLQTIPADLDFSSYASVPNRSIHLGYERWAGSVLVNNPALGVEVCLQASAECNRLQLFSPALSIDEPIRQSYVCVEPMTHTCNAHRMAGDHGLRLLKPGESMQTWMTIRCTPITRPI